MLEHSRLLHLLDYDQATGIFRWRNPVAHNVKPGQECRSRSGCGYLYIMLDRKRLMAHQLAWFYVTGTWPPNVVDHINGTKTDNRFANLRLANRSLNAANSKPRGSSGFKGVTASKKRWRAQITVNQKVLYLGLFKTREEAHAAYVRAAEMHFGEYARAA